jgi:hypothetical protein
MNNLNNTGIHDRNRGVELLLYRRESKPKENTKKKVHFEKTISFFQREFKFKLEFSVTEDPKLSEK